MYYLQFTGHFYISDIAKDWNAGKTREIYDVNTGSLIRRMSGLMTSVAKLGGMLHLPLNSERLKKLTENYVSSNAKIKKALGVDKMPVRAKDGLRETIKSFVCGS